MHIAPNLTWSPGPAPGHRMPVPNDGRCPELSLTPNDRLCNWTPFPRAAGPVRSTPQISPLGRLVAVFLVGPGFELATYLNRGDVFVRNAIVRRAFCILKNVGLIERLGHNPEPVGASVHTTGHNSPIAGSARQGRNSAFQNKERLRHYCRRAKPA